MIEAKKKKTHQGISYPSASMCLAVAGAADDEAMLTKTRYSQVMSEMQSRLTRTRVAWRVDRLRRVWFYMALV